MVLGIIVSAVVYKFHTNRLWSESFLFGLFTYLIFLGLVIVSKLLGIPQFTASDFIYTALFYFVAVLALNIHRRFRVTEAWKLGLYVAGSILLTKLLVAMLEIEALLGISLNI